MLVIQAAENLRQSNQPIFDGPVSSAPVVGSLQGSATAKVGLIRFEPGARTRWHTHDGDQLLIIVAGRGYLGTAEVRHDVAPGDVVHIPAGEVHYHGASETEAMAHYSVLGGTGTEVLDSVSPWPPVRRG